jgi:hypothetical protein
MRSFASWPALRDYDTDPLRACPPWHHCHAANLDD